MGRLYFSGQGYPLATVSRSLVQRIHNPHGYECGCGPDCWCRRTALGRAVKWWFPARYFGLRHKNGVFEGMTEDEVREWKRRQALR
jgi:hypothetical protein